MLGFGSGVSGFGLGSEWLEVRARGLGVWVLALGIGLTMLHVDCHLRPSLCVHEI